MPRKLAFAFVMIIATSPAFADETPAELKGRAVELVKEYSSTLQTALKGAMEAGGPVGGIAVCHEQAPQIAADISQRSGWTVARTSLKVRNPASAPDAYATEVMQEFQQRIAKGEAAADLTKAEVVEEGGVKVFRFIKAIPTGELCLTCHGTDVKPELKAKLQELYPDDQAIGFKPGDMRGVFTLSKRL